MRKRFFSFSVLASSSLLLFGAIGLTACNSSESGEFQPARVSLNTSVLNLAVGESARLRVSIAPKSYRSAELRWFTSNDNVAYVNDRGYVFAVGEGTSTVTAAVAGGYASCTVNVSGEGGGGETNPYLVLSPASKSIGIGDSFELNARVYPADTTVTFTITSGSNNVTLTPNGNSATIAGTAEGPAVITAVGTNGKSGVCNVTVTSSGGGGDTYDMGVLPTETYTATIKIGASEGQSALINSLVAKFNQYTGSHITAQVIDFNEAKAADLIATDPTSAPHIYPFASDQTLRLYNQNIIQELSQTSTTSGMMWIEDNMGETALDYATLPGVNKVVGYPFASDNGYVLFYNTSLCTADDVATIDSLFAKSKSLGYEVDYDLANGAFYNAGALMSYAGGQSLFNVTVKNSGYNASANFDSDAGLSAARAMFKVFKQGPVGAAEVPSQTSEVMATIVDCSNVKKMKDGMGSNYAVAPLPYVSDEDHTRLGVYLGYKLYGINPKRANTPSLYAACDALARFFTSEYAQVQRFNQFYIKPTCLSLQDMCANEPHIKALNQQLADNGVIPLNVVTGKLWDQTSIAAKAIQTLTKSTSNPTDAQLKSILGDLDDNVTE